MLNGADDRSPRWRHLLVIGGLLLGFEGQNREALSPSLKRVLERALIKAANLALEETRTGAELGAHCVALVLNHTFELLSDYERSQVDYDVLMPLLIRSTYRSTEGLESGYFLGTIDTDIIQVADRKFSWSAKSSTFVRLQRLASRPLVSSIGPMSRLIAHTTENVRDPGVLRAMVNDLCAFTRTVAIQWRQNKLSEVDMSEEAVFLTDEALRTTLPVLWKVLKTTMFATVIALQAIMGRVLNDATLAGDSSMFYPDTIVSASTVLTPCRRSLSRHTNNSYTAQSLLHLLSPRPERFLAIYLHLPHRHRHPPQLSHRVRSLPPRNPARRARSHTTPPTRAMPGPLLPQHRRAFHFSPIPRNKRGTPRRCRNPLSSRRRQQSPLRNLRSSAQRHARRPRSPTERRPNGKTPTLLRRRLAQGTSCTSQFPQPSPPSGPSRSSWCSAQVCPQNLSARQFRLAFKTLLRITAPPSPLSETHPLLPATLLELLYHRARNAPATPLPSPTTTTTTTIAQSSFEPHDPPSSSPLHPNPDPPLSEQAVLTLTLIDALPFLQLDVLEEWLPLAADLIHLIPDPRMRRACRERFWEVLSAGELDVDRAAVGVAWWCTRGGREMVLFGQGEAERGGASMSGGLYEESKL